MLPQPDINTESSMARARVESDFCDCFCTCNYCGSMCCLRKRGHTVHLPDTQNSLMRTDSTELFKIHLCLTKIDLRGYLGVLRVSSRDCLSGVASPKD